MSEVTLMLAILLFTCSALAEDWAALLPDEAVEQHVEQEAAAWMVVGAGESDELAGANEAVVAALRRVPGVELVMTAAALGDVAELGDSQIVALASGQPVDRIAVVRIYPTGSGHAAVITVYDKGGATISSMRVATGRPLLVAGPVLAPAEEAAGVEPSPARELALDVAEPAIVGEDERKAAFARYREERVYFMDLALVNSYGGAVMSGNVAYHGQYREPLRGARFYEYIGRDDLAHTLRTRRAINGVMYGAGIGLIAAGIVIVAQPIPGQCSYQTLDDPHPCMEERDRLGRRNAGAGIAVASVGAGAMAGAVVLMVWQDLLKQPERRREAARFNAGLAEELGLTEEDVSGLAE